jgi:hypothetical protein
MMGSLPGGCRRFCAEKAFDFYKSQQPSTNGLQQLQYQSVRNNKFQQVSIRVGICFGTRGVGGSKSSFPQSIPSNGPSLDDQRDGHSYRLYACIGAGSSHCERESSRRCSRRRWWWRIRASSAAADAKQHSERASRKDPAWNLPPGSFPISKQNYYQQADGQRPGTDAKVGRGRP